MADEWILRPLYLLLFTAGFVILVALAVNERASAKPPHDMPPYRDARADWTLG
jgi:hypothetical protein